MATTAESKDVVVFLLPDGTEVSNDPRFYEQKMREQILAQQRELLANSTENTGAATGPSPKGGDTLSFSGQDIQDPGGTTEEDDEDVDHFDPEVPYKEQKVGALKAEAERRQIDLTGIKKKSELIQRLEDYDESQG